MRWRGRHRWPAAVGRLDLAVMSAAYAIFGLSQITQSHRWQTTPAYRNLLLILPAPAWGSLFLVSGVSMGVAAWQFTRRWAVIASLTLAVALTGGWGLAFVVRYLTSPNTTPETWVSWGIFGYLLLKVALSISGDAPAAPARPRDAAELARAVDDALEAAHTSQKASLARALDEGWERYRDAVSAASGEYADALRAAVPAGAMRAGELAQQAIAEARHALLRAEEAYERATGQPAHQDPP